MRNQATRYAAALFLSLLEVCSVLSQPTPDIENPFNKKRPDSLLQLLVSPPKPPRLLLRRQEPENAEAYFNQGLAYFDSDKLEKAA